MARGRARARGGAGPGGGPGPSAWDGSAGLGGSLHTSPMALGPEAAALLSSICSLASYCVPGTLLDSGCTVLSLAWEYRGTVNARGPWPGGATVQY